jgi:hypothetical protein
MPKLSVEPPIDHAPPEGNTLGTVASFTLPATQIRRRDAFYCIDM